MMMNPGYNRFFFVSCYLPVGTEILVGELELCGVLDVLSVEKRMDFHHRIVPFKILLEEQCVSVGVEGGPHGGVMAEAEDEEVAGTAPEEDV